MNIKPISSSHYYNDKAEPQFNAKLGTARKENYLPSITTVMKIIAKPGLEAWKQEQVLLSSLKVQKLIDENDKDYIKRIVESSREESSTAAGYGSEVHEAIESWLRGQSRGVGSQVNRSLDAVREAFIDDNIKSLGNIEDRMASTNYGYAGTIDWWGELDNGRLAVIDWKTQGIKWKTFKRPTDDPYEIEVDGGFSRPVPNYYDEWIMQLWAGLNLVEETHKKTVDAVFSVVINSDDKCPNVVYVREWTPEEIEWGGQAFLAVLNMWRIIKKFPYEVK